MMGNVEVDEESQYLNLIKKILATGEERQDRTNTGTLSLFAPEQLRFKLSEKFPLLTTKRVGLRIVFEELIWFIRGSTNGQELLDKKVTIWEGNGSREYLDSRGLTHYKERIDSHFTIGDLGPVYGFQWRHFGAKYIDCHTDYTGQGVDQLRAVIDAILFNPFDRRIILSAWNPQALGDMALPPCHMTRSQTNLKFCQFYVSNPTSPTPTLSCQMYQRSADIGLGVPFNIASYALLLRMIAHVTNLLPGEFVHVIGDAHVYKDHVEALGVQVERQVRGFPSLEIKKGSALKDLRASGALRDEIVDGCLKELETFEFKDFELQGYNPHGKIVMKMSV